MEIAVDDWPKSDVTEMKWNVVLLTLNYIYVSTNFYFKTAAQHPNAAQHCSKVPKR